MSWKIEQIRQAVEAGEEAYVPVAEVWRLVMALVRVTIPRFGMTPEQWSEEVFPAVDASSSPPGATSA